jgi:long-chain acyl-CoA synthetase
MPRDTYKESSIGLPFPDTTYKIVGIGTTEQMPLMEEGEICINGPTVMMGYVDDPKETIQTLKTHKDGKVWLHTGDIGYMDKDGFVYFRQRLKRVIISSGYNIYPTYIENVINSHEAVLTSTVIGIDHPYKVQVAKAFIVLKDGIKPTKEIEKSIKEHCEKNIAKYSMPYKFEFRTSLPKTLVGKVAYRELEKEEQEKSKQ